MNDIIPVKYRLFAALLHGIGKIPMLSVVLFCILSFLEQERNRDYHIGIYVRLHETLSLDFFLPVYGLIIGISLIFAQPIFSLILWQITKRWHSFVDVAGKIAVNRSVNVLLAMTVCAFLIIVTAGIANPGNLGHNDIFIEMFFIATVTIFYAIAIGYFIDAAIASTFALRGKVFRNRFIHDFIKVDR